MRPHRISVWLAISLILPPALGTPTLADEPRARPGPANRLARETSPYLLLHAHNPVDWYPWGPEAFAKAKAENKPIFLSIGYSSCFWCHVMERESFTNAEVAKVLNAGYVAIKVDREERPDVDQVYMTAVQLFQGSGGWPMSVFMLPDGRPFFGGTYYPKADFLGLLQAVSEAWRDQRPALERDAKALAEAVQRASANKPAAGAIPLTRALANGGLVPLAEQFDPEFGGFGFDPARPKRPKFPEPVNLIYLLDLHRRNRASQTNPNGPDALGMVVKSLDAMARGGIRDHLAGGYHRYSTVRDWSVPHFEKMLYDNAQLVEAHVFAFEVTGDARWRTEAEATLAFVARAMTGADGLFASALDAESEAEEGKSYVWTRAEVEKTLGSGDDARLFLTAYGLDRKPNFERDRYVLLRPLPIDEQARALGMTAEALETRLAPLRSRLLQVRDRRPQPALDDKVLTSWNALMITAYAEAGRIFREPKYRAVAEKAADAVLAKLRAPDGRLLRTSRGGAAKLPAYLEDYAFLTYALTRLHAATGDPNRLTQARALADRMIADFADPALGGFFYTATDHETLLARPKDPFDNAVPGANSVAIRALVALGVATGEARYLDAAGKALQAFAPSLRDRASGSPLMLVGLHEYLDARPPATAEPAPAETPLPGAPGVVTAKLETPPALVKAGSVVRLPVTLTIRENFHIYANPAGSDDVRPTVLGLRPTDSAELGPVHYPAAAVKVLAASGAAKVSVYEKTVTIEADVKIAATAPAGPLELRLQLRYQACDDRACLAPMTLDIPVRLEVIR
jgi:uncharacterized protein YyaL (SSP411 family)